MRVHKIDLTVERLHIDLDCIQLVEPPTDTPYYDYGFTVWLALRNDPIFVSVTKHEYSLELRKRYVDEAFEILYTAWCGKKFE